MDEDELGRMLRAASDQPPAASFTVDEVTRASRRITRRRRTALASAAGAVVLLAGGGVVVGSLPGGVPTTASDPGASVLTGPEGTGAGGSGTRDPGTAGSEGADPSDGRGPAVRRLPGDPATSTTGCAPVDPEVAAALADGLGVAPGAEPMASPVPGVDCSAGVRSAAYRVGDAIVSAVLVPPDDGIRLPEGSAGTDVAEHRTGDGTLAVVVRTPTGHGGDRGSGAGPRLDAVAETVAESATR